VIEHTKAIPKILFTRKKCCLWWINRWFEGQKISFKTFNPKKPTKCGLRLFVLPDSETGYVHSIIPYYGKITGEVCNLPYPDKPFTTRIVLSLMDCLRLSVSGIWGYLLFTDRYYSSVDLAKELDKGNVTQQAPLLPEELEIQSQWDRGPWRRWSVVIFLGKEMATFLWWGGKTKG
jgi:hypothetical protein